MKHYTYEQAVASLSKPVGKSKTFNGKRYPVLCNCNTSAVSLHPDFWEVKFKPIYVNNDCEVCSKCGSGRYINLTDILREIDSLFGDNLSGVVILSSIHKSKGREWKNVYYLTTPQRKNLQDWELEQERNLAYVAITRSMENLFFVECEK